MNDPELTSRLRVDAAKAWMPFKHQKLGEGGKTEAKHDAAKRAGAGRFSAAQAPKLIVHNSAPNKSATAR